MDPAAAAAAAAPSAGASCPARTWRFWQARRANPLPRARHDSMASQQSLSLSPTCTQRTPPPGGGVPTASTPVRHLTDSGALALAFPSALPSAGGRAQTCWWPNPSTNGEASTPPLTSTAMVVCSSRPEPPAEVGPRPAVAGWAKLSVVVSLTHSTTRRAAAAARRRHLPREPAVRFLHLVEADRGRVEQAVGPLGLASSRRTAAGCSAAPGPPRRRTSPPAGSAAYPRVPPDQNAAEPTSAAAIPQPSWFHLSREVQESVHRPPPHQTPHFRPSDLYNDKPEYRGEGAGGWTTNVLEMSRTCPVARAAESHNVPAR